jgi:hypothetical protein
VALTPRRAAQVGDVFAVRTLRADGLFGRVVSTAAIVGPTHGCNLVYLHPPGSRLSRDELIVPPMMTTRAPWSHGYFTFVRSEPLLPGDFFERHCFRDDRGRLFDEESRPLEASFEPVGQWRLYEEVEGIDAVIAAALGALTQS